MQTRADCRNLNHLDSPYGDHEAEAGAWSLRLGMQRQVTEHSLAFPGLPVPKEEQLGLMLSPLSSTCLFLEGKQKDICESKHYIRWILLHHCYFDRTEKRRRLYFR